MKGPLYIIQSSTTAVRLEQALDTALVAAIFNKAPGILIFSHAKDFEEFIKQNKLQEKLAQLNELNVNFSFTSTMLKSDVQACILQSTNTLTF